MTFNDKFAGVREAFIESIGAGIKKIAALFGYPENPGMKITDVPLTTIEDMITDKQKLIDSLPLRKVPYPPIQRPETLIEMLFGTIPKVEPIPRTIYESTQDGYYNFYIENYRNIFFLPNWLSEFLQVRLNYCLDITYLEVFREIMFLVIFGYAQLISLRIALSWFLSINPYTVPWIYLVAMIDWTEEAMMGVVPTVVGLNLTGTVVSILLGRFADSINHLVFTMPFLPSEGQPAKTLINEELRDVLVFRYLPILWYRYPIPNEIREYWYTERPDILKYMQKAYQDLDIQFLPDQIIEQIYQNELKQFREGRQHHLSGIPVLPEQTILSTKEHFSAQVLATTTYESVSELPKYLSSFTGGIHDLFLQYFEKLG